MSEFEDHIRCIVNKCEHDVTLFTGGRLKNFLPEWRQITSDDEILSLISGALIQFNSPHHFLPSLSVHQPRLSFHESCIIDSEILNLLDKQVIFPCQHEQGEVISSIFTTPKKDGSHRMILNLKKLNTEVTYHHFKMDTLATSLKLISENCFMASIDLKDAYYSVPIHDDYCKFLRFEWQGQMYQFVCMPNGLAMAPRKFTKLMKPVFSLLRQQGHISSSFLDDSLLIGNTKEECQANVLATANLMSRLGFVIHPFKSVFQPSKQIQYLGVIINSESMTVKLTEERAASLKSDCIQLLKHPNNVPIRQVAKVIGKIVASFQAVKYGPLYYRCIEEDKKLALKDSKGNFDDSMALSAKSRKDLKWWIDNILNAYNDIYVKQPQISISSDASLAGWGGVCNDKKAGGAWKAEDQLCHINFLELKAALFALKSFGSILQNKHVRILLDNTTAVACINHMGTSHSVLCNDITREIWHWCIDHNIWLSAAFIPGVLNTEADIESRKINYDAEWKLNSHMLRTALNKLSCEPTVDLFASQLNAQFDTYVSFRPDPQAIAVDAFCFKWKMYTFYAFPPFSVLPRVLQKIRIEEASGILVVPDWPTQVWYPLLQQLLVCPPVRLNCTPTLLSLPSHPHLIHPLVKQNRLNLLVCKISGSRSTNKDCHLQPHPFY